MYTQIASMAIKTIKDYSEYNINRMDGNQEIISRLKFIGKLKKGEKINTCHMYVQQDGITTSLSRTFAYQDNRGNALNFCQETISRSFELLITYERSDSSTEKVLFSRLIEDLQQSTVGLRNLKFTYITDIKFCCDMDTLLENVLAKLYKYTIIETNDDEESDTDKKQSKQHE
tara:strand:+ start:12588 stop:13106 length:519 start_codon:yes stop_codon:yes gene_type:complete